MSLAFDFPRIQYLYPNQPLSLYYFEDPRQIYSKLSQICEQSLLMSKFIQLSQSQIKDDKFLMRCPQKKCPAYLYYQSSEQTCYKYQLKQYSTRHIHFNQYFKNVQYEYLKPFLCEAIIFNFPSENQSIPNKYIRFPDSNNGLSYIREQLYKDWSKKYNKQNFKIRQTNLTTLSIGFHCQVSDMLPKQLKCPWKLRYNRIKIREDNDHQQISQKNKIRQNFFEQEQDQSIERREQIQQEMNKVDYAHILNLEQTYFQHKHYSISNQQKQYMYNQNVKKIPKVNILATNKKQQLKQDHVKKPIEHNTKKVTKIGINYKQTQHNNLQQKQQVNWIKDDSENQSFGLLSVNQNQNKSNKNSLSTTFTPLLKFCTKLKYDVKFLQTYQLNQIMVQVSKKKSLTLQNFNESKTIIHQPYQFLQYQHHCLQKQQKQDNQNIKSQQQFQSIYLNQDAKDFNDIIVISSKLMRFLSRSSYGQIVYLTEIQSVNDQQSYKHDTNTTVFSLIVLAGLNFMEQPIYFGATICRNSTLSKIIKILCVYFKNYLKRIKTLIILEKQQHLIYVARQLKQKFGYTFNIVSLPGFEENQSEMGFSIASEIGRCQTFKKECDSKKQGVFKRMKSYSALPLKNKFLQAFKQEQINSILFKNVSLTEKIKIQNQRCTEYYPTDLNLSRCVSLSKKIYQTFSICQKSIATYILKNYPTSTIQIYSFHSYCKQILKKINRYNQSWGKLQHRKCRTQYYWPLLQLQQSRKIMSRNSFDGLCKQIAQAQKAIITCQNKKFCIVDDGNSAFIVQIKKKPIKPFHVNRQIARQELITIKKNMYYAHCECEYLQRTQLPCSHMLKVMIQRKIGILQGIQLPRLINLAILKPGKNPRGNMNIGRIKRY